MAKLLFMVVQWIRDINPFQDLSDHDQRIVLEETWTQVFLIHLGQWSRLWNIMTLLENRTVGMKTQDVDSDQAIMAVKVLDHTFNVTELLYQFYLQKDSRYIFYG